MSDRDDSYDYDRLIECGHGNLFGKMNAQLPLPPMLMVDRITHIATKGGAYDKGQIKAELDIHPDLWFFNCHFEGDPVMPGCLGLDAMWQLVGFYLGWSSAKGKGRALGVGNVRFTGQVTPETKRICYTIDLKRIMLRRLVLGVADGTLEADGVVIYTAKDLRVGLFQPENHLSATKKTGEV